MSRKTIVVLSGAGMSAESGLGTFRDSGGLWDKHRVEDVATPEAWSKNPKQVTDFYNIRRKQCYETTPNLGHYALAELEKKYNVIIVTQNIDDLHERAGSTNVIHLHGEINKVKSSGPNAEDRYYEQKHWEVKIGDKCPEGYQLRPHVVWFGESVPMLNRAAKQMEKADIFVVVGTSLNVYPAASLVHCVPDQAERFLIDPNDVDITNDFRIIKNTASEGLKDLRNLLR